MHSDESLATASGDKFIDRTSTFVTLTVSDDNQVVVLPTSNTVQRGHVVEIYAIVSAGTKKFKMKANPADGINGHSVGTRSKAIEVGIEGTLVTCKNVAPAGNHSWVCTYVLGNYPHQTMKVSTGPIIDATVIPASLVAGDSGNVTVTFTVVDAIPSNGQIYIEFPGTGAEAFNLDNVGSSILDAVGMDGQFVVEK